MRTRITLCVGVWSVLAVTVAGASGPYQWRTEDGGNGHFYEWIAFPETYPNPGITWEQAYAAAEAAGGYLATITSAEENAFIYALPGLQDYSLRGAWLGGYQLDEEQGLVGPAEGWHWVTGEDWSYTNWQPGEPNDWGLAYPWEGGGYEDRLNFWCWPGYGNWNDEEAWNPQGYVNGYIVERAPGLPALALVGAASALRALTRRARRE